MPYGLQHNHYYSRPGSTDRDFDENLQEILSMGGEKAAAETLFQQNLEILSLLRRQAEEIALLKKDIDDLTRAQFGRYSGVDRSKLWTPEQFREAFDLYPVKTIPLHERIERQHNRLVANQKVNAIIKSLPDEMRNIINAHNGGLAFRPSLRWVEMALRGASESELLADMTRYCEPLGVHTQVDSEPPVEVKKSSSQKDFAEFEATLTAVRGMYERLHPSIPEESEEEITDGEEPYPRT